MKALFLYLFLLFSLLSSSQDYNVEDISLAEGLSQSTILAIEQDNHGFLWFGTQDGLNRYDGQTFTVFRHQENNPHSLQDNYILSILNDSHDNLWIGTARAGLFLFDKRKEEFIHVSILTNDTIFKNHDAIYCLKEDDNGNILLSTKSGIKKFPTRRNFDPQQIDIQSFEILDTINGIEKMIIPHVITPGKNGILWLSTVNRLYRFDSKLFVRNPKAKSMWFEEILTDTWINDICIGVDGILYTATQAGIFKYTPTTGAYEWYDTKNSNLINNKVHNIKKDKNGNLIIATRKGINILSLKDGKYINNFEIFTSNEGRTIVTYATTSCILIDKFLKNVYWIGTYENGVVKISLSNKEFQTNNLNSRINLSHLSPSILSLIEDSTKVIWLLTQDGILQHDQKKDSYKLIKRIDISGEKYPANIISRLFTDKKGNIFAAGYFAGIYEITTKNSTLQLNNSFHIDTTTKGSGRCFEETDKGYLFCTWNDLFYSSKSTKQLKRIPIHDILPVTLKDTVLHGNNNDVGNQSYVRYYSKKRTKDISISSILFDSKSNLWLGLTHGLLFFENISPENLDKLPQPKYYPTVVSRGAISGNNVKTLIEDRLGNIWAGTFSGVAKIKATQDSIIIQSFTESNGLPNNTIYAILEDTKTNNIWISSNKGLSAINAHTGKIMNYDIHDGLQSNEFNLYAAYMNNDGKFFFGGINGYTTFYGDKIKHNTREIPIYLTKIQVNNSLHFNLLDYDKQQPITLGYKDNSFNIQYIGLDYNNPKSVTYCYDLDGADLNDIPLGKIRMAHFSNLSPGQYTFRVKTISKDGIINKNGDAITIIIKPPFWNTIWFKLLIFMIIAGTTWLFFRSKYKYKTALLAEIEQVRKDAARDFHDEMGGKLSVISLYSNLAKSLTNGDRVKGEKYLDKVILTSNSLYGSMRDLLWSLDPDKDKFQDLFAQLIDFGEDLFQPAGISFHHHQLPKVFEQNQFSMQSKRNILLIFKEAMANSLKHANCTNVTLAGHKNGMHFILELKDDGQGFDKNQNNGGEGEGLKNMKNRANKIHSEMVITSDNTGTSVKLLYPLNQENNILPKNFHLKTKTKS